MSSVTRCPKCSEPVFTDGKCWHCGWNTSWCEESYELTDIEKYHAILAKRDAKLTGGSSSYYELPEGCKELQDLIEYKNMNFARGNVFKAAYRLGDKPGTDQIYDWEKIIWFAQREIERLKKNV
jgi:hypothetical protein